MQEIILLRYINIVLAIIGVICWIIFYKRYKQPFAIAPITWIVNVAAFSIYRLCTGSDIKHYFFVTTWSGIIVAHGIILLIAAALINLPYHKQR